LKLSSILTLFKQTCRCLIFHLGDEHPSAGAPEFAPERASWMVSGTFLDYPFTPAFTKPGRRRNRTNPFDWHRREMARSSCDTLRMRGAAGLRASGAFPGQSSSRYQGILMTMMRRLPRISRTTFSRSERRLCSMPCHQCRTTSSGTSTHTLQASLSRSTPST